jgi:hypothetical protein
VDGLSETMKVIGPDEEKVGKRVASSQGRDRTCRCDVDSDRGTNLGRKRSLWSSTRLLASERVGQRLSLRGAEEGKRVDAGGQTGKSEERSSASQCDVGGEG